MSSEDTKIKWKETCCHIGRDIKIVDNSVEIMKHEHAKFIESHDIVVKFGRALEAGQQFGQQMFGEGSLGRVEENPAFQQQLMGLARQTLRPVQALQNVRGMRQQQATEGLSPEQRQLFRDEGLSGINQQLQSASRLARGNALATGVGGGSEDGGSGGRNLLATPPPVKVRHRGREPRCPTAWWWVPSWCARSAGAPGGQ